MIELLCFSENSEQICTGKGRAKQTDDVDPSTKEKRTTKRRKRKRNKETNNNCEEQMKKRKKRTICWCMAVTASPLRIACNLLINTYVQ